MLLFFHNRVLAQDTILCSESRLKGIGINVQVYPAGVIATINKSKTIKNGYEAIFRFGGNLAARRNLSPYNDYEMGGGFGLSVGLHKYIELNKGRVLLGLNTDVWNIWINWQNNLGKQDESQGQTYTTVLQPWIETGYFFRLKHLAFDVGLTTGFGREMNIITRGKEVGQGWMNSLLIYCCFPLK